MCYNSSVKSEKTIHTPHVILVMYAEKTDDRTPVFFVYKYIIQGNPIA